MKRFNRVLSVILSLALVLSLVGVPAFAVDDTGIPDSITTTNIDGETYLEFNSADDLVWWAGHVQAKEDGNFCTHNIILTADIDMGNTDGWTGVGNAQAGYGFGGVFNGNGHTISNISWENSGLTGPKGTLLNYTQNATIKYLTLQNCSLTTNRFAGGLLGRALGSLTLENVFVNATVTLNNGATNAVGGLVGQIGSGQTTGGLDVLINNCAVFGNYTSNTNNNQVGGLIGHLDKGFNVIIKNSYVNATLSCVTGDIAGLVGGQGTVSLVVDNCYYRQGMATEALGAPSRAFDTGYATDNSENINVTPKSDTYMQSTAFLTDLGSGFVMGSNGYPVPRPPASTTSGVAQIGTTVYATVADAITAAVSGETVTLLSNATENVTVLAGKNMALDLAGKTLTGTLTNAGTLTVQDSVGGGKVTGAVTNTGTLTLTGGTYSSDVSAYAAPGYIVVGNTDGTYTVVVAVASVTSGSTVTYYTTLTAAIAAAASGNTVTLLTDTAEGVTVARGKNITLDLNGKTLAGEVTNNGTLTIQDSAGGGEVTDTEVTNTGTLTLTSGTYHFNPLNRSDITLPSGYTAESYDNGTYTVILPVAQIGDVEYGSLTFAFSDAESGDTVTLTDSFAEDATVPEGANVTLDLNGKTLTGTVSNEGTLTIQDSATGGTISSNGKVVLNKGTATIKSGTFVTTSNKTKTDISIEDGDAVLYNYDDGSLTVQGGTFNATVTYAVFNRGQRATMSISGGTFNAGTGVTTVIGTRSNNNAQQVQISGGTYNKSSICGNSDSLVSGYMIRDNEDGTYTVTVQGIVASVNIGGTVTTYSSLTAAINAAGTSTAAVLLDDSSESASVPVTVTLLESFVESTAVPEGANIILELNGKTLNGTIANSGALTIQDSVGGGSIVGPAVYAGDLLSYFAVRNTNSNAQLIITGGRIIASYVIYNDGGTVQISGDNTELITTVWGYIVKNTNGGTVEISGGTIDGTNESDWGSLYNEGGSTMIISGGVIDSYENAVTNEGTGSKLIITGSEITSVQDAIFNLGGSLEISGGSIASWGCAVRNRSSAIITGGTFATTYNTYVIGADAGTVQISGGTFNKQTICDASNYLASGCAIQDNGDGTYTVVAPSYAVSVTSGDAVTYYESLTAAIAAAGTGDTITLLDSFSENIAVPTSANIILELNGKTLTGTVANSGTLTIQDSVGGGSIAGLSNTSCLVQNTGAAAHLTITGGCITAYNHVLTNDGGTVQISGDNTELITTSWGYVVKNTNGGTVEISGGTIDGSTESDWGSMYNEAGSTMIISGGVIDSYENAVTNEGTNSELVITGGEITSIQDAIFNLGGSLEISGGSIASWGCAVRNRSSAIITGGTFATTYNTYVIGADAGTVQISGGTYNKQTICDASSYLASGYTVRSIGNGLYTVTALSDVACIINDGTVTTYSSLTAAINAAGTGDTITLLDSFSENIAVPTSANIILELNGKTLTGTVTNSGTLTIQDSVGGGSIAGLSNTSCLVQNTGAAAHLTITGGCITAYNHVLTNDGGTVQISGDNTELITTSWGYVVKNTNGGTVEISGGTIDGSTESDWGSMYNEAGSTMIISGGVIDSYEIAVTNSGTGSELVITGGEITSIQDAIINSSNLEISGGGITSWGCAVRNSSSAIITGGTFATTYNTYVIGASAGTMQISGGTYNKQTICDASNYLANGYTVQDNNDGTWSVVQG